MNILDIAEGHVRELLNLSSRLSESRLRICYKCPLYSRILGGVCDRNTWIDPATGDTSGVPKEGYVRGCGCRTGAKTRLAGAECPAGKW